MANVNLKDSNYFEYSFPEEIVNEEFFIKSRIFSDKMSHTDKMNFFVDYLEHKYSVVSPSTLEKLFGYLDLEYNFDQYDWENLLYFLFKQRQVNLRNPIEKERFKQFLEGKEVAVSEDMFPEINIKEKGKERAVERNEAYV